MESAPGGAERGVGVPQPVGQPVEAAAVVGLHHVAVAVEIGNVGDLVGRQAMLDGRMPGPLGRRMDRPEMSGEGDLLVVV
jgi:hypothetical protein